MSDTFSLAALWAGRARWFVIGGLVVVVVVVVVVAARAGGGTSASSTASAPSSPSASASGTPSSGSSAGSSPAAPSPSAATVGSAAPTTPSGSATTGVLPGLPPMGDVPVQVSPLDGSGDIGDHLTARVVSTSSIQAAGSGIGEVSGPAVLVTLEVTNSGTAAVSLAPVAVTAYTGADGAPASPITSESRSAPFTGEVAPGATARGSFVFGVPATTSGTLAVLVVGPSGASAVVFHGTPQA